MEREQPVISPDVLARYAGDAAREVPGVAALAVSSLHRGRSVEIAENDGALAVTVHIELEWGRSCTEVGIAVQRRVREYVERMTNRSVATVELIVARVTAPPASR